MDTSDLLLSIIIILIFVLLYFYNILDVNHTKVKNLWPLYRCNPVFMPMAGLFGHDPATNFNNCVQNVAVGEEMLAPVKSRIDTLMQNDVKIDTTLTETRQFVNRFRKDIGNIVSHIMRVLTNLTINTEKSNISIKDSISRLTATLTAMSHYNQASATAAKSKQNARTVA